MFGCQPCLPTDYYFPIDQVMGRTKPVDKYMSKLVTTLRSAREVTQKEAACQKRLYDRKVSVVTLEVGDIVLVRTDAFQDKRKIKDRWGDVMYKYVAQVDKSIPVHVVKNQHGRQQTLHCNQLFLMLRLGPEDRPTLIGKLLTAMIHHCDLAAPHFETNVEGVMPNENKSSATTPVFDWKRLHGFIQCIANTLGNGS